MNSEVIIAAYSCMCRISCKEEGSTIRLLLTGNGGSPGSWSYEFTIKCDSSYSIVEECGHALRSAYRLGIGFMSPIFLL